MDHGILVPFIVVALPVIALAMSSTINRFLKLRERQVEFAMGQAAEKAARYAANGAEMEQRVRVLERIVTDRGIDIADEIERLHDLPAPETTRSH